MGFFLIMIVISLAFTVVRVHAGESSESKLKSSLQRDGNTILKFEYDNEKEHILHVRYRDADYNLHVETYAQTFLGGLRRTESRIMRNHNEWLKGKKE